MGLVAGPPWPRGPGRAVAPGAPSPPVAPAPPTFAPFRPRNRRAGVRHLFCNAVPSQRPVLVGLLMLTLLLVGLALLAIPEGRALTSLMFPVIFASALAGTTSRRTIDFVAVLPVRRRQIIAST